MLFHKMHGLGNDFILLHNINPEDFDLHELAIKLCDRRTGIGADGILLVLPSDTADIRMRIINSDGSEPDMCGNGIRCFAKYVFENRIVNKTKFTVETRAGIIKPELIISEEKVDLIRVDMGEPVLKRKKIPAKGDGEQLIDEVLRIDNIEYRISSLLMTIPHTIVFVNDLSKTDIKNIGPKIEKNGLFPEGTNVDFVQVLNENEINLITWERGAGLTLACGTGSCASVVASALNNKTKRRAKVHLALGDLEIDWTDNAVFMTGPATNTFNGEFHF